MSVRAADDFDAIRRAREDIRAQEARAKRRCRQGCGAAEGGQHRTGCLYSGLVISSEVDHA